MKQRKFQYEKDQLGIETEEELQAALKKYNCKTEQELDDLLWYTYGISLINNIGK